MLSYFLAGHFALFFSKQKLSFGRERSRAECSLLQQLVVSWKELCVIDESWANILFFFFFFWVNFTVLFLNLHVHLPAALLLVIIFLLSRWMYHEQRENLAPFWLKLCSSVIKFCDLISSVGLRIEVILQHRSEQSCSQFCLLSGQKTYLLKRPYKVQWQALIISIAGVVSFLTNKISCVQSYVRDVQLYSALFTCPLLKKEIKIKSQYFHSLLVLTPAEVGLGKE